MGKTFGKLYLFTFIIAAVAALFVALGYKYKLAIPSS
jgi:quinol-cytochrome oxidoreductase complex cytochrome b subunit